MRAPPFQFDSTGQQAVAARLGMWVFLGTELMFFGPLFVGYYFVRSTDPASLALAARHTELLPGTLNTFVLMTSSLVIAMAVSAARDGRQRAAVRCLWATAALGLAFLVIKSWEYANDLAGGFVPANASGAGGPTGQMFRLLYYAMTGLHAIHLCIGIGLVVTFALAMQQRRPLAADPGRVEIVGLYWHFVDMVWLFLFPLLYLPGRSGP